METHKQIAEQSIIKTLCYIIKKNKRYYLVRDGSSSVCVKLSVRSVELYNIVYAPVNNGQLNDTIMGWRFP